MNESDEQQLLARFDPSALTLEEFADALSDPGIFVGGGAAGALSLADAAATAQLVVRLSSKRKKNLSQAEQIETANEKLDSLRRRFFSGIGADVIALDRLMRSQRELRSARKASEPTDQLLQTAFRATAGAIETPIELAKAGVELLRTISRATQWAAPFTLSDLGAAAIIANGGIGALLLMAEVNLTSKDLSDTTRARYRTAIDELRDSSRELTQEILAVTGESIRNV